MALGADTLLVNHQICMPQPSFLSPTCQHRKRWLNSNPAVPSRCKKHVENNYKKACGKKYLRNHKQPHCCAIGKYVAVTNRSLSDDAEIEKVPVTPRRHGPRSRQLY